MQTPEEHAQTVKAKARKIASEGKDIRHKVEVLVQQLARELQDGSRRLVDVAQDVMDGAAQGIKDAAPPDDQQNRLRQVIDGLGDGFSKAAIAMRLAIEEAAARGEHFAKQDMTEMVNDMRSLRDLFVDVVTRTSSRASSAVKNEAQDTADHVKRTFDSLKPSLEQAMNAATGDPAMLAKETTDAISKAGKQAAGALFAAMGDLMQHAASKLDPKHGQARSGSATGDRVNESNESAGEKI